MRLLYIRMHPDRLVAFIVSGRHHSLRLKYVRFLVVLQKIVVKYNGQEECCTFSLGSYAK
jgi:hypothetical protein